MNKIYWHLNFTILLSPFILFWQVEVSTQTEDTRNVLEASQCLVAVLTFPGDPLQLQLRPWLAGAGLL